MPAASVVYLNGKEVAEYPDFSPDAQKGNSRRIAVVGDTILRKRCKTVAVVGTDEMKQLIADMFRTMYAAGGIGLAANQVGVGLRIFVYDCADEDGARHVGHIINPSLRRISPSHGTRSREVEGCLSVPGPAAPIDRAALARVRGVDNRGNTVELEGSGAFARCLQHEMDHLEGRVYLSRLPLKDRMRVLAQMQSMQADVLARRETRDAEFARIRGWPMHD
ncbi:peptide deformylase (plasmid) [Streptomycetaceae bacterium NBC_01309]